MRMHCRARVQPAELIRKGISTMNKLQENGAVIAGATSSMGLDILRFVIHLSTQRRQSRIVLALVLLPLSLVMQAQTVAPAKRFSFADLQHLQSVLNLPNRHDRVFR